MTHNRNKGKSSRSHRLVDMTGEVVGRWTVLSLAPSDGQQAKFLCRCVCGLEKFIQGRVLREGRSQGCADCAKTEKAANSAKQHPEYTVWMGMRQRCSNPNSISYKNYGARGISVCDAWLDSFEQFLADVGPRPGPWPLWQLDRIDNERGYEPGNCRWATSGEQGANKRTVAALAAEVELWKSRALSLGWKES